MWIALICDENADPDDAKKVKALYGDEKRIKENRYYKIKQYDLMEVML